MPNLGVAECQIGVTMPLGVPPSQSHTPTAYPLRIKSSARPCPLAAVGPRRGRSFLRLRRRLQRPSLSFTFVSLFYNKFQCIRVHPACLLSPSSFPTPSFPVALPISRSSPMTLLLEHLAAVPQSRRPFSAHLPGEAPIAGTVPTPTNSSGNGNPTKSCFLQEYVAIAC